MHLVHHSQLHHSVFVVIDGLVVHTHGDVDAGRAHLHHGRDTVAHVKVAARLGCVVTETWRSPMKAISSSVTQMACPKAMRRSISPLSLNHWIVGLPLRRSPHSFCTGLCRRCMWTSVPPCASLASRTRLRNFSLAPCAHDGASRIRLSTPLKRE